MQENIIFRYLHNKDGLETMFCEDAFILYKIDKNDYNGKKTLCFYHLYSEDKTGKMLVMLKQLEKFYKNQGIKYVETYLDNTAPQVKRTTRLIKEFGFTPYKGHEDYTYFIKRL